MNVKYPRRLFAHLSYHRMLSLSAFITSRSVYHHGHHPLLPKPMFIFSYHAMLLLLIDSESGVLTRSFRIRV